MECAECLSTAIEIKYYCACFGIPVCLDCVCKHFGPTHYVYNKSADQIESEKKYMMKALEKSEEEIAIKIKETRESVEKRSARQLELKKGGLMVGKWEFSVKDDGISSSIRYDPPKFIDFENLGNYLKVVIVKSLCCVDVQSKELYVIAEIEENLIGFSVFTYKKNVYLCGGCNLLGLGVKTIKKVGGGVFNMRYKRFFHSCVVVGGKLYAIGGSGDIKAKETAEVIDLKSKDVEIVIEFNEKLELPVGTFHNDSIYIRYLKDNRQQLIIIDSENKFIFKEMDYGDLFNECLQIIKPFSNKYIWTNTSTHFKSEIFYIFDYNSQTLLEFNAYSSEIQEFPLHKYNYSIL